MKRPAFQFYPADWRNDAALRMCSLASRGLWWEMICVMHTCEPYGHLVAAGRAIEPEELARIVGESARDVTKWIAELERKEVFSRTPEGIIYCRRMLRDSKQRDEWRDRQDKSRARHADVTDAVTPESPRSSSSTSSSPSGVKEGSSKVERAQRAPHRGTRWPPDQLVSRDWITDGDIQRSEHGLSRIDLSLEATRFANYWASKSGANATKTDWHRTWINWALDDKHRSNGKVSAHDKGTLGAALWLAEVERERLGDGDGASGDCLPTNGHGPEEVVRAVPDVLRGSEAFDPSATSGRVAALSERRGQQVLSDPRPIARIVSKPL